MGEHPHKILLVEPDPELLEIIVAGLSDRFDAQVTCVSNAEACLSSELADPHDLIIAEVDVAGGQPPSNDYQSTFPEFDNGLAHGRWSHSVGGGLRLAETLTSLSSRPIILLADEPTCREVILALRLGVRELLARPFPVEQLLEAVARLLHGYELRRQHVAKYHKMRNLVRRVIRERRDLNQRVELICRDLVGAHRRLVNRVLEFEGSRPR